MNKIVKTLFALSFLPLLMAGCQSGPNKSQTSAAENTNTGATGSMGGNAGTSMGTSTGTSRGY